MNISINKKSDRLKEKKTNTYELIILFRSNAISNDIHNDLSSIISLISMRLLGEVLSSEYWGIRPLSYEISGNKKAHFHFFAIEIKPEYIKDIKNFIANNVNIIRYLILKSDFDAKYFQKPTVMMQNLPNDIEKEMGEIQWNESYVFKI